MTTLKHLWIKLTGSSSCEGIKKHNLCLQNTPKKMIICILRFWATTFTAPRLVKLICATCFADCMHTSSESSSTGRALPGQTEHRGDSVSVTHTSQGTQTLAAWGCSCFFFLDAYTSARELGILSSTHFRSSSWKNSKSVWKKRKCCHLLNCKPLSWLHFFIQQRTTNFPAKVIQQ